MYCVLSTGTLTFFCLRFLSRVSVLASPTNLLVTWMRYEIRSLPRNETVPSSAISTPSMAITTSFFFSNEAA